MMTGRVVHHCQAPATCQTIRAEFARIIVAFPGQDQTSLHSRIIRKLVRVEFGATMSTGNHYPFSR